MVLRIRSPIASPPPARSDSIERPTERVHLRKAKARRKRQRSRSRRRSRRQEAGDRRQEAGGRRRQDERAQTDFSFLTATVKSL
jgi:hypothetical protein